MRGKGREGLGMADQVFWIGDIPETDDFGLPIDDIFIDGRTCHGPWAIMNPTSWAFRNATNGEFGVGKGQKYKKQEDGRWLKVEG